jgi:hypothetical protein
MKKLYRWWGDQVQFVSVLVRQEHPGPRVPPYRSFEQKMEDAVAYKREEGIPWPVVVDDLEGSVHRTYGGLSNPTYLIDADGRIAFYNMWTYAPVLHEAIEALVDQGGRGVAKGGWDRAIRLGPTMTHGWRAIQRGLPQSFIDLTTAAPGSTIAMWLGYQLRPLLAPLTLRARPLPVAAKIALLAAPVSIIAFVKLRRRKEQTLLERARERSRELVRK